MQLARQGGATPGHSRGSKTAKPPRRRWFQPAPPIGQTILMSGSLWPLLTGQPACVAGVCRASIRSARSRAPTRSSMRPGASCPVSRSRRHAGRGRSRSPGSRQSPHRVPRPPRSRVTGSPGPPQAWQISALSAQAPVTIPRTRSAERPLVSPTRFEQQLSVGGPTLETDAVAVGESHCRRDEASPAGHRFTLPAASFVSWPLAWSSTPGQPYRGVVGALHGHVEVASARRVGPVDVPVDVDCRRRHSPERQKVPLNSFRVPPAGKAHR